MADHNSKSSATPEPISILLIPYPTFNVLDLTGPLDVLGNVALEKTPFKITVAASAHHTTSYENAIIARNISLHDVLPTLHNYDVLIQPGGNTPPLIAHLKHGDDTYAEIIKVVQKFATLGPSERLGGKDRIIMSICTGALFCAYAGIFAGLQATTHYLALGALTTLCNDFNTRSPGSKVTSVVPVKSDEGFRYVKIQERKETDVKVRVISSGGISCGLDATLYLVALLKGREMAVSVASIMQYAWREM